jgi:hypothetical protein
MVIVAKQASLWLCLGGLLRAAARGFILLARCGASGKVDSKKAVSF